MRRRFAVSALLVLLASLAMLASTFAAAPLAPARPIRGELPRATPPSSMAIFQLPTGVTHRSAAFAYRGGSFFDKRDFAMTALLVKHPQGDLLIDTGFGRSIDKHFALMPFGFRTVTSYTRGTPAAAALDSAHYERSRLRGILLTHAHWDHVSGVEDFPRTRVLVTREEHRFIESDSVLTAVIRSFPEVSYEEYSFEGAPYLGFPRSHDVYGDGSIVVVPAPGHTPGSVIVFLTLPSMKRYAFIGDLAWQREGVVELEERPWIQRSLGDSNATLVRENLLRMNAIARRFPDIEIVPAHDARAFASIPLL